MTLEKQVCSLELAKKLKELGVKQESYFDWWTYGDQWRISDSQSNKKMQEVYEKAKRERPDIHIEELIRVSAFTVAELGELLYGKVIFEFNRLYLYCSKDGDNKWHVEYDRWGEKHYFFPKIVDENEANARAKMLIEILEREKQYNLKHNYE